MKFKKIRLLSFLSKDLEYIAVCVGNQEHLTSIVSKFSQRASLFRKMALFLLLSALLFVGIGVAVFLFPTRFTDLSKQTTLLQTLENLVEERSKLLTKTASIESDYEHARLTLKVLFDFAMLHKAINDSDNAMIRDWTSNGQLFELIKRTADISENLNEETPEELELDHSNPWVFYSEIENSSETIPPEIFKKTTATYQLDKIRLKDLASELRGLQNSLVSKDTEKVLNISNSLRQTLTPYSNAFKKSLANYRNTREIVSDASLQGKNLPKELAFVEKQIRIIEDAIQKESHLTTFWENWIPTLTIRLCVVILLLFLTNILLSTYRYLVALGAYYAARSDAVQLASEKGDSINIDEYKELVEMLSPEEHKIDKTESPDDKLIAALSLAINKIPGT